MESREGKQVPDVTFKMRIDGKWCDVTTDDIFKGKSIAVFALPGAFTVCTSCGKVMIMLMNQLYHPPVLNLTPAHMLQLPRAALRPAR